MSAGRFGGGGGGGAWRCVEEGEGGLIGTYLGFVVSGTIVVQRFVVGHAGLSH